MNKHRFASWKVWIGLAVALAMPFSVYAAHVAIDTNDGWVDPNWVSVTLFSADGDDWADDNYDIDQAWVTNEANNSYFYFRVSLIGTGQLPLDNWSSIEAHLDCDQDGNDYGASDVIVYYYGNNDASYECQGSNWPDCSVNDNNGITSGEEILGTPNNYEWQADVNNGSVDWSACLGTVNIRFVTLDSTGAVADTATVREYDAPTVVTLEKFVAGQHGTPFSFAVAMLPVGVIVLASIGLVRRRSSRD
ncbi:MAG: hypothetical protein JXA33_03790 [Anaerolineae bacterium]|nr:hypothetical protein [Anaerolineae bacterium]